MSVSARQSSEEIRYHYNCVMQCETRATRIQQMDFTRIQQTDFSKDSTDKNGVQFDLISVACHMSFPTSWFHVGL